MKSKAQIAGHPLHPIFVSIPIGLWSFSIICDLIYHFGWGGADWKMTAFYCIGGGLVGAVLAMITGWIDYALVTDSKAQRIAAAHLYLNAFVSLLFLGSFAWRYRELPSSFGLGPVLASGLGVILLSVSGWLGGELVSRFRISVHE